MNTDDFGMMLDEATIKKGLRELNPDLHFDMGAALNLEHPFMADRQGVFYKGRHLCSMDRGSIPEYTIWSMRRALVSVPASDALSDSIKMPDPLHPGRVKVFRKTKGRVLQVGWRHTFERIIKKGVPGVTRETISNKFKVPIKFLVNDPNVPVGVESWQP